MPIFRVHDATCVLVRYMVQLCIEFLLSLDGAVQSETKRVFSKIRIVVASSGVNFLSSDGLDRPFW